MVPRTVLLASLGCRWADGGAFFRSHYRASLLADANGSQVVPPSPRGHGTVLVGHGKAKKLAAAADVARTTRQRIDANRALLFQPTARSIRAPFAYTQREGWPGEHHI